MERPISIAIIGGGRRCRAFLDMLDAKRFPRLHARIVGVADPDGNAVGIRRAREKGIFTTGDYRDFSKIRGLDLVIELAGKEELLEEFLKRHPVKVRGLQAAISRVFGDILRMRREFLLRERSLELIEEIVDSVFLSIKDWVLILQPDRRILDVNEACLRNLGLDKEEVVGRFCHEVIHRIPRPCESGGLKCPMSESLETGAAAHAIHEHLDQKGRLAHCEVTTIPLKDRKGNVEIVLEIISDITDELEEKVTQKTEELKRDLTRLIHEDKLISLGKLVAGAAHEINNPLSGIHALARLMREELEGEELSGEKKEKFKYYLRLIDTESARCSAIVGNLLSFSRQKRVEFRPFQLNDLVDKAVLLSRHRIGKRKIRFHRDLADELPLMTGDPGQIQQCLLNLVFNAIEAMPDGGALTIRTRLDAVRNCVRLEVADEGVGIPEDKLSQIFEPFYSTKTQDKGIGLGLSVVYGIVKEHGGTISVRSEVGVGSRFILQFPLEATEQHKERSA